VVTQVGGQALLDPSQRYGVQLGLPDDASGRGVQLPRLPATSQPSQLPVHAPSQQNPSTQKPLAHCTGPPHPWPVLFLGTHWLDASQ
jgi:hypothetical protein